MFKESFLPLNLQMFAEGDTADAENESADEETQEEEAKTFTQAEVDDIVAARKARWELKNKKDVNPPAEETDAETLKATVEEKDKELQTTRLQVEALKAGVPAGKVDKFVKLASLSDEEDLVDRVAETLADFPEFSASKQEKKKKFIAGGNPAGENKTMAKAEIMAIKNTKERQAKIAENIHLFKN